MKCTYCGYENEANSGFCSNCGKKLQESADNGQVNFNQTASSNAQMGGYVNQSNGYGQSTNGYNNQSNGYGQPTNGYNNQPNGYGQPTNGYNNQSNGYGQPTNGYNNQSNGYGQPINGYSNQPNGYGQPINGYSNQPNGYGQPTNGYNNQPNGYGQQAAQNQVWGNMPEKDFYQRFASKGTKGWAVTMIVLCFLSAAVGAIQIGVNIHELRLAMMFSHTATLLVMISVIEIVYYVIMGILLLAKKKWFLTLIIAIVEVITRVALIIISETFTYQGVFFLIIAIICTTLLKKVNDAYKIYKNTGNVPERPI